MKIVLLLWVGCLNVLKFTSADQRPIYNIAHMVNSIREINYYLNRGANAVEADVTFSHEGDALETYHGSPCDCFRLCNEKETIDKYLRYVREITSPASPRYRKDMALLFLDLQVSDLPGHSKFRAGDTLAEKLIDNLWPQGSNASQVNVILSIGHTSDSPVVKGFKDTLEKRKMKHLEKRIGWDIGLGDTISEITGLWRSLGVRERLWQGDGASSCVNPIRQTERLKRAIDNRNNNDTFTKVYRWTIDLTSQIRDSLRRGVDAIVTNHPERVNLVLGESEFQPTVRAATIHDNPFERSHVTFQQESGNVLFRGGTNPLYNLMSSFMELFYSMSSFLGDSVRYYFRSEEWAKAEQEARLRFLRENARRLMNAMKRDPKNRDPRLINRQPRPMNIEARDARQMMTFDPRLINFYRFRNVRLH